MHTIAVVLMSVLLTTHAALAASIPATCEAAKQQQAGLLRQCLHKAEQKLATSGDPGPYDAAVTKCTTKFSAQWQAAEQKAIDKGGSCPASGDAGEVQSSITANVASLTAELETGDAAGLSCGNGAVDSGEDCDLGTSFGGATCASVSGGTLDFGTLACDADCGFDTSGCKHCPGQLVGGYCWLYGNANASCDDTCTAFGLAYDPATWFYAGSSGDNARCNAVLNALGAPAASIFVTGPAGAGCSYASNRYRDLNMTASAIHYTNVRRACACR